MPLDRPEIDNPDINVDDVGEYFKEVPSQWSVRSWDVNSTVTLTKVPWDAQYRDVVEFDGISERDEYFDSLRSISYVLDRLTYLKPNNDISINLPYAQVYGFNYVIVRNPEQYTDFGFTPPTLFYFVTEVGYTAPNTTTLTLQLDVWQTYCFSVEYGRAFVVRGHVANNTVAAHLKNAAGSSYSDESPSENWKYLTPYLLRRYLCVPESIDLGSDYWIYDQEVKNLVPAENEIVEGEGSLTSYWDGILGGSWWVVITCTANLDENAGDLSTGINISTAKGCNCQGVPSGCNVYAMTADSAVYLFENLADYSWLAKTIVQMTLFPARYLQPLSEVDLSVSGNYSGQLEPRLYTVDIPTSLMSDMSLVGYRPQWGIRESKRGWSPELRIDNVFDRMKTADDGTSGLYKLATYPYSVIELNNKTGTSVLLKPQMLRDASLTLLPRVCYYTSAFELGFYPDGYGSTSTSDIMLDTDLPFGIECEVAQKRGYAEDYMLTYTNFPMLSIVVNEAQYAYASNAATYQYNYDQAGWNRSLALSTAKVDQYTSLNTQAANETNAQRTYNAAELNADLGYQQSANSANTSYANTIASSQANLQGSAASFALNETGALLSGRVDQLVSNVGSLVSTALVEQTNQENAARTQETALTNASLSQQAALNSANAAQMNTMTEVGASRQNIDANYQLANYAAQGNYDMAVQAVDASIQDLGVTTPSQAGQLGGDLFNIVNGRMMLDVRFRGLSPNALTVAASYFMRYGYAVNEYMMLPDRLCINRYFTYWSLLDTYITAANMPESCKDTFRGILEKGVTVWRRPEYIGNADPRYNYPSTDVVYYE